MVEYRPRVSQVIEFAYDVRQPWGEADSRLFERAAIAVGALPRRLTFQGTEIGRALSYHVEVVAPADTDIAEARIDGEQYDTVAGGFTPLAQGADALLASAGDVQSSG